MTHFILANGFPPALIFLGFAALVAFGAIFGRANKPTPRVPIGGAPGEAARVRAELQRRAEAQRQNVARAQGARGGAAGVRPPAMPQQGPTQSRGKPAQAVRKSAAAAQRAVPAAPNVAAARAAPQAPRAAPPKPPAVGPVAGVAHRQASSGAGAT